jgi:hypothetical protein
MIESHTPMHHFFPVKDTLLLHCVNPRGFARLQVMAMLHQANQQPL